MPTCVCCLPASLSVHTCMQCLQRPCQDPFRTEVTGGCEPPNLGARNWTWFFWKSSTCHWTISLQPYTHNLKKKKISIACTEEARLVLRRQAPGWPNSTPGTDLPSEDSLALDDLSCRGFVSTVWTRAGTTESESRISWVPLVDSLEDRLLDKSLSLFSERFLDCSWAVNHSESCTQRPTGRKTSTKADFWAV